jgi:hypothetical protein
MLLMRVSPGNAETGHPSTHHAESTIPHVSSSKRIALTLPQAAQEGLKLTMREHLEALDVIVAAVAREDFAEAATVANEELGFPKHHVAMQREQGAHFPSSYHELAMAHHQAAEDLGAAMPSHDLKIILPKLAQTIHACVTCHQTFRLQK